MQRSRGSGHGVVVSKICYNTVTVLSVVLCDCCKPTKNCQDCVAASLLAANVPKMWCTAESRCVGHLCLRNPFPLFLFGISSIQPIRSLRFLRAAVRSAISALNHGCIMPIPWLQLQKKIVLCREAEGLVTDSWSQELLYNIPIVLLFVLWILATVSWTCGCQPFSCRCLQNVMYCRKKMYWTCLFKESMPFVQSKPPLPTRSLSFQRAAYVPPSLH